MEDKTMMVRVSEPLAEMINEHPHELEPIMERVDSYVAMFSECDGGAGVLHRIIDMCVKKDLQMLKSHHPNERLSCTRKCSSCCYQNVDVFDAEAKLYAAMIKEGHEYNSYEFKKQLNMTKDDYKSRPRPCIFLKKGECTIYDQRPVACRKYFVVTPSEKCHIEPNSPNKVGLPPMLESEIVYTAYGTAHEGIGPMVSSVNKYLIELEERQK